MSGFNLQGPDNANYKMINCAGQTLQNIQTFLRNNVKISATYSNKIKIIVSTESCSGVKYFADNGHYYKFFGPSIGTTWLNCYNGAKASSFLGRNGYLVTIHNAAENQFLYDNWSSSTVGFTGGTRQVGVVQNGQYYSSFNANGSSNYIWACGPEIGRIFYTCRENG